MASSITVAVPDLGDFKSVDVIDVLVQVGDLVDIDTPLATLETEKATMDVPSTASGRVVEIFLQRGQKVVSGAPVVRLESVAAAVELKQPPQANSQPTESNTPSAASTELAAKSVVSVTVPDLGDFKDVDVVDVLVNVGDLIEGSAAIATLETEKATMDVPSSVSGRVVEVLIKRGDKVASGSVVAKVEVATEVTTPIAKTVEPTPPSAPTPPPIPVVAAMPVAPVTPTAMPVSPMASASTRGAIVPGKTPIEDVGFSRAYAGPSVRLLARELGVDLGRVSGTGVKGRITHTDVKTWVKQALATGLSQGSGLGALPRVPVVDYAKFGAVTVEPLSRIQKISGPRLHASWVNIPHVTQYDEADITNLEATRASLKKTTESQGIKLTPLAFIIRACVLVLKRHPRFNASLDEAGENLVLKQYLHIGFAADTPNGLVVPVLRDADKKDVYEIARDLAVLSEKARGGKLTAADMQGGCFTISSLGGIGGTAFTPIINAPEVAILGVSKSSMKPVWNGAAFIPRLMLPLSLSYDHRVIDGASAARFTTDLSRALEDIASLTEAVP